MILKNGWLLIAWLALLVLAGCASGRAAPTAPAGTAIPMATASARATPAPTGTPIVIRSERTPVHPAVAHGWMPVPSLVPDRALREQLCPDSGGGEVTAPASASSPTPVDALSFGELRKRVATVADVVRRQRGAQDLLSSRELEAVERDVLGQRVAGWHGWITGVLISDAGRRALVGVDMDDFDAVEPSVTGERDIGLADIVLSDLAPERARELRVGQRVSLDGAIGGFLEQSDYYDLLQIDSSMGLLALRIDDASVRVVPNAGCVPLEELAITLVEPHIPMSLEEGDRYHIPQFAIYGSGRVVYQDSDLRSRHVVQKEGRVTREQLLRLVEAFDRAGYFALADDYAFIELTDVGSSTTAITFGKIRKSIYAAAGDLSTPDEVWAVVGAIDDIVDLEQFAK